MRKRAPRKQFARLTHEIAFPGSKVRFTKVLYSSSKELPLSPSIPLSISQIHTLKDKTALLGLRFLYLRHRDLIECGRI